LGLPAEDGRRRAGLEQKLAVGARCQDSGLPGVGGVAEASVNKPLASGRGRDGEQDG
jgi:hypothetical protein